MVTLAVLFTGFFTAARFRMTEIFILFSAQKEFRAKPPPQGEVPSEARRKGAVGCTENTRQGWTLAEIEAAVVPPSVGSADSSPQGGAMKVRSDK